MEPLGVGALAEIRREANAWLIQMDVEPDGWDRRAFVAWLKLSPSHMEEFQFAASLWLALHDAKPIDIQALCRPPELSNVTQLPLGGQRSQNRRDLQTSENRTRRAPAKDRLWFAGFAASILLLTAAWVAVRHGQTQVLITDVGEQRIIRLSDRSVVHLNTNSRVDIHFTGTVREVRLVQGEALFTVERDVNRPFRVHADDVRVEALGTQFNVRRRQSDTIVSVVEGRVALIGSGDGPRASPPSGKPPTTQSVGLRVSPDEPYEGNRPPPAGTLAVVAAGEQIQVSEDGHVEERPIQDVTATTAWQRRQLMLNNTPLADVVAELARYNVSPEINIEGDVLRTRQINGVFAVDYPESLIEFLARDPGVAVHRSGDVVAIRLR